jgi:hypothetical protein
MVLLSTIVEMVVVVEWVVKSSCPDQQFSFYIKSCFGVVGF